MKVIMAKPSDPISWITLHYIACMQGRRVNFGCIAPDGTPHVGRIVAPHPEQMAFSVVVDEDE